MVEGHFVVFERGDEVSRVLQQSGEVERYLVVVHSFRERAQQSSGEGGRQRSGRGQAPPLPHHQTCHQPLYGRLGAQVD